MSIIEMSQDGELLVAEGYLQRQGKGIYFARSEVWLDSTLLLATAVGTFKYLDLQDPGNNREQKIAIENCVLTNVTSMADLFGLGVVVGLRSDDFFRPLIDPNAANHSPGGLLKFLGR